MANPEHLVELQKGVTAWNEWRKKTPDLKPDLSRAEISKAVLIDADLSEADLSGSNLFDARLGNANCHLTKLQGCDLRSANLWETNLLRADLSNARLGDSRLIGTHFRNTELRGADLTGAEVGWTIFGDIDLSHTRGLELCTHGGPSTVGIDTIYKSKGEIPEIFLRGAGLPDSFITYARSLVGQAIEFYSCFISYSTQDQDFAERLHADLQSKAVRCWFAPHDIQGGKKIHEQIDDAIRLYDKLLLILSRHSINSEWVKTEIAKARKREIQKKQRMLFPVRLMDFETLRDWEYFDADTGKDSAREIREYFIPDFSNWKDHDSYKEAFERLLRDLKAEASKDTAGKP